MPEIKMNVKLVVATPRQLETLYVAYRTCYSDTPPEKIWEQIDAGKIELGKIKEALDRWMSAGHESPLEHILYVFAISGISRALSHQLVRHRIGIAFSQQSQRYVEFTEQGFTYIVPETIRGKKQEEKFKQAMEESIKIYRELTESGIPPEDARFVIPNACSTNFTLSLNFRELLHICDLRLCARAQWEIRRMVAKMRAELTKLEPFLGEKLMPQCGWGRRGYCSEPLTAYQECPMSRSRPHVSHIFNDEGKFLENKQGERKNAV